MNYSKSQDLDFPKSLPALNESSENLPAPTLDRLAQARKLALSRKKKRARQSFGSSGMYWPPQTVFSSAARLHGWDVPDWRCQLSH
jgi:hypothetical protein